jgi:hypothetical protein
MFRLMTIMSFRNWLSRYFTVGVTWCVSGIYLPEFPYQFHRQQFRSVHAPVDKNHTSHINICHATAPMLKGTLVEIEPTRGIVA